jgi:hypothetical protein
MIRSGHQACSLCLAVTVLEAVAGTLLPGPGSAHVQDAYPQGG